jgi:hypothetical protein
MHHGHQPDPLLQHAGDRGSQASAGAAVYNLRAQAWGSTARTLDGVRQAKEARAVRPFEYAIPISDESLG